MTKEIIKIKPQIVTFSLDEENYIELYHIIADESKVLTDGEVITKDIYFSKSDPMDQWYEIDYEEEENLE